MNFQIIFLISIFLMVIHKIESYITNEYNACPFYINLINKLYQNSIGEIIFLVFCFTFLFFMFIIYSINCDNNLFKYLVLIYAFTFIHETHHLAKTLKYKNYYSGTISAIIYFLFGFLFSYTYVKKYYPKINYKIIFIFQSFILLNYFIYNYNNYKHPNLVVKYIKPQRQYRVLITGGNVGIGKDLTTYFRNDNIKVINVSRNPLKHNDYYKMDITNNNSIENFINKQKEQFDCIILNSNVEDKIDNNIHFVKRLLDKNLIKENGKIINITSISIFAHRLINNKYINTKVKFLEKLHNLNHPNLKNKTINSFHPGIIMTENSDIYKNTNLLLQNVMKKLYIFIDTELISKTLIGFLDKKYDNINKEYFNVNKLEKTYWT